MRFAFISDIHGNLQSLELVLTDIQRGQVDQIVCLGDIASLGPQPREVIARLRGLDIPIIKGNHEDYLIDPGLTKDQRPWLRETEEWCHSLLTDDELDFLRSFPPQLSFEPAPDTKLLCYHGSPRSNEEWIYPDTPAETLDEIFPDQPAQVLVGGHTHVQMLGQHRGMTLLNPGSVGMPFEFPVVKPGRRTLRRAEYAILDWVEGRLSVDLRRIPIDFERLSQAAYASGMPEPEFWLSKWDV